MTLDLDRLTHPLRLAKGSHEPGSGKGCAMNVISYINGDARITDYPECSARPLAKLVQILNDALADRGGYLSPENSVLVLDLGWRTVGTADVPREVVLRWLAELLTDPTYGVMQFAVAEDIPLIRRVADLLVCEVAAVTVSIAKLTQAQDDAVNAIAYYCLAYVISGTDVYVDYATIAASNAYSHIRPRIEFTRWAIETWRALAGLDDAPGISPEDVDYALQRIGSK